MGEDFERFYRDERDSLVRALTIAIGSADLASEVVDEAMARAYQRWSKIGRYDAPAGWVYRVALNEARSLHRRRRRGQPPAPADAVWDPEIGDPMVAAALRTLLDHHRSVVVARHYLDWTVDQIATALEISPGTVKSRLHRAHVLLAQELETLR